MDEEMGDLLEEEGEASAFGAYEEIDFDYEYAAPMFFDFTRPESNSEVNEAERWFESAESYPTCLKLKWRIDEWMDVETSSSMSKDQQNTDSTITDEISEVSSLVEDNRGQMPRPKSKSPLKPFLPRSSTLLKPTASHLAKQNQQVGVRSTNLVEGIQRNGSPKKPGEIDATKRQKLEVGYLRRVAQLKHQIRFAHKSLQKIRLTEVNSTRAKEKLTIPNKPELEKALSAQKHRSKHTSDKKNSTTPNDGTFNALPLNRKLLEAPSLRKKSTPQLPEFQVFHLRTSGRAMQQYSHNVATVQRTNSSSYNKTMDLKRTNAINGSKLEQSDSLCRFKPRPLKKKIFSSNGDIGIFRNKKQEVTVSKEFKFSSNKRHSQNPPMELFNKLSLTSENKQSKISKEKRPLATKENAPSFFTQENKIVRAVTQKSSRYGTKRSQFGGRTITKIENHPAAVRSFKIN
ncbi:hypothetical protein Ancab_008872 [Ancistrocladus abbreviatus]